MAYVNWSRRQFIKQLGASLGSLALLEGCTTLDQLFFGESADLRSKVVIVGAGLSGLLCAWELKKRKIPFVMFERSSRLGGQVMTLPSPTEPDFFWIELGPVQGFWSDNVRIMNLTRELQIPLLELPIERLGKDAKFLQVLSLWQWGLAPEELDGSYRSALESWKNKLPKRHSLMVIDKGSQRFVEALSGQLFGSFVEGYIRLQHEWIAVEPNGKHWDLVFRTPQGRRRFEVERVMVAFNPWLLKKIKGAESWVSWPGGEPLIPWSRIEQKLILLPGNAEGNLKQNDEESAINWVYAWKRKNLWGEVKKQETWLMARGRSSLQARPALMRRLEPPPTISWDWLWQKGIQGCSLPPVRRERCPSFYLPPLWQHTHLWLRQPIGEFLSSPWELCAWSAKQIGESLVAQV